jgi:hypothetical protein
LCYFDGGVRVTSQIFISYARDDNTSPPDDRAAKGFVTYLYEQLQYELQKLGQPRPEFWTDKEIKFGDQFEPRLNESLATSSHLLVVFSRNWMDREWCRKELDLFGKKWPGIPEGKIREQITVVALHDVPHEKYPTLLQGQEGFRFFSPDPKHREGMEASFFDRGKIVNPDYKDLVKQLARDLWIKSAGKAPELPAPEDTEVAPPSQIAPDAARIVFLAKPAGDMEQAYLRLVEELQGRNISVAPPPKERIPADSTAAAFVVNELAKAELSIHLLGEKSGYTPEDTDDPIAELQIRQAAVREAAQTAEQRVRTNAFRRLIWAPKILDVSATGEPRVKERDPLHVVNRFDHQLPSDKIESDSISKFVDFVIQHLERTLPIPDSIAPIQSNSRVYLHHLPEDADYAVDVAAVLQAANIEAVMPAFEGGASELMALHRENLKDCDSIVLCWASATEVWVKASSRELRDWQKLGRNSRFACRGLIAGPPPGDRKNVMAKIPPREIDIILDLTAIQQPTLASLERLVDVTGVGK